MDGILKTHSCIIESGASRIMYKSMVYFAFDCTGGPSTILMDDDSEIPTIGKGRINIDYGWFMNVLYIPSLGVNILSVYQMTHIGVQNKVVLTLDGVDISKISTRKVIALGTANHDSKVYEFSHFLP